MTVTGLLQIAKVALTILLEIELLIYAHSTFVAPLYYYLGIPYSEIDTTEHLWLIAMVLFASLFLPQNFQRVSGLISWLLFVFCFVPSLVMSTIIGVLRPEILFQLQMSLLTGMIAILAIPRPAATHFPVTTISSTNFWVIVMLLYFGFIGWIIGTNYGNMNIVGMADVYVQRFSANGNVGASAYAMGILSGSIDPFLMAVGLVQRKPLLFILGALGQVVVYAVLAQKFVFLSIFYIPGFFYLLGGRKFREDPSSARLSRLAILSVVILLVGSVIMSFRRSDGSQALDDMGTLLLMRQFSLPGGLVAQYAAYFTDHPLTYFTHISIVKAVFGAVYTRDVGLEIGSYLVNGGIGMNANANFFASDGIAALYLLGPVTMGIVVGLCLRFFDMVVGREQLAIAGLTLTAFGFSLSESSLFTSLLTGGGFLCLPVLYLFRSSNAGRVEPVAHPRQGFQGVVNQKRPAELSTNGRGKHIRLR
jgi:hypothetical protein